MVYRLFLSHSSPTQDAKERLRELAEGIEAALQPGEQAEVLYDLEQIVGSDDWRRRIAFMLHVCHGGVVLLDEAALSSKWVLAEATFLSFRQAWDASFACIPVSFLDQEDLESAKRARAQNRQFLNETVWSVVQLPAIQYVRGISVVDIAGGVVSALREKGHLRACATPADRLADQLAAWLSDASRDHLRTLASRVEQSSPYLTSDDPHLAALAMVQEMLATVRLTSVRQLVDGFGISVTDADCLRILDGLSPLALQGEASAMLRLPREGGGLAHASLCCQNASWIVPLYVRRAYVAFRPPTHFAVSNTLGTFEELSAGLRNGLREQIRARIRGLSDQQLDERLRSGESQVYAWIPGPVDAEVMAWLDASYPRVTFIVHHQPGQEPTALPPGVEQVLPPLTPDEEDRIMADYMEATEALETREWAR